MADFFSSPLDHRLRKVPALVLLAALVALPWMLQAAGQDFYLGLATRVLIFGLAATSLNLVLGFGGLVSFGHAAFVGAGAYTVAILMQDGIASAWIAWPAAVLVSALLAAAIGAISLRTRGVYFIMITLAFAQMLYYVMTSLKAYGGEDGLSLMSKSLVAEAVDLGDERTFYLLTLAVCALAFLFVQRLLNARFGHTLQGLRENETRMAAIGFPVFRYRLAAFVLAGALAGVAGVLLVNQSGFVSPSLLDWHQSGLLLMMVILGGVGHLYGGLAGAAIFLLLEELLSGYTTHWKFVLGLVLLAVVLLAPNGVMSFRRRR
ncbi:branched-chain amino acid ABC transporter permease [Piscinibacter gummiphilus]|uniref:Branched-chain amino acid ABC transporter permease n=1 Tax=Piscinibacter gummiphilus TaxID=946333 RepID=A0A1W6L3M4_9BURK|nr:branched-chain amino acid ABC transporter permease [Piscinibacter gummiphilus]ARN18786.1 branched-chain amino acid ABC transporter permease [Piscinibacter gummiphilus]ATU63428.1 branched-chain amino acid ABC transporter permease [Piscinibacter gummiphilus]GLS95941.1 branched-chain amino acid ABC transporter permease [Piscinibacter gummiphilus]